MFEPRREHRGDWRKPIEIYQYDHLGRCRREREQRGGEKRMQRRVMQPWVRFSVVDAQCLESMALE